MSNIKLNIDGTEYELQVTNTYANTKIPTLIFGGKEYIGKAIPKEVKPNYEILSFIEKPEAIELGDNPYILEVSLIPKIYRLEDYLKADSSFNINSVRRISDGEVFTIWDETPYGKIKSFRIHLDFGIIAEYEENGYYSLISELRKVITKKLLLKLDDGTDVFEGDTVYVAALWYSEPSTVKIGDFLSQVNLINAKNAGFYWFSTKEKAQEWLDGNKKCFSINDIKNVISDNNFIKCNDFFQRLKNLKP